MKSKFIKYANRLERLDTGGLYGSLLNVAHVFIIESDNEDFETVEAQQIFFDLIKGILNLGGNL